MNLEIQTALPLTQLEVRVFSERIQTLTTELDSNQDVVNTLNTLKTSLTKLDGFIGNNVVNVTVSGEVTGQSTTPFKKVSV